MRNLLDFLARHNHWILFLFLEVVSFVLLFQYNSYQGSVWFTSANGVAAGINRMYGDAVSYVDLKEVNRHLTDENTRLQIETEQLREALTDCLLMVQKSGKAVGCLSILIVIGIVSNHVFVDSPNLFLLRLAAFDRRLCDRADLLVILDRLRRRVRFDLLVADQTLHLKFHRITELHFNIGDAIFDCCVGLRADRRAPSQTVYIQHLIQMLGRADLKFRQEIVLHLHIQGIQGIRVADRHTLRISYRHPFEFSLIYAMTGRTVVPNIRKQALVDLAVSAERIVNRQVRMAAKTSVRIAGGSLSFFVYGLFQAGPQLFVQQRRVAFLLPQGIAQSRQFRYGRVLVPVELQIFHPCPDGITLFRFAHTEGQHVPEQPEIPVPDATISIKEMQDYGYSWDGMFPLKQEAAERLFTQDGIEVFRIYEDGTEGAVTSLTDLQEHAEKGGLFGVEKETWEALYEYNAMEQQLRESEPTKEALLLYGKEDSYGIYQLAHGDATRDLRFEPYDRLQATGHTVDRANYELIYTAPLEHGTSLEDIYTRFNIDHPKDFKGHSLSVSDVVVLHQNGQDAAHYVDSFGYKEVPEFLQEQTQQPEKINPLKHVEDTIEQNDNNFDGIINNTPTVDELEAKVKAGEQISLVDLAEAIKADKERGKEKPSIRAQLKADKERTGKKKNTKQKSQDLERS